MMMWIWGKSGHTLPETGILLVVEGAMAMAIGQQEEGGKRREVCTSPPDGDPGHLQYTNTGLSNLNVS